MMDSALSAVNLEAGVHHLCHPPLPANAAFGQAGADRGSHFGHGNRAGNSRLRTVMEA